MAKQRYPAEAATHIETSARLIPMMVALRTFEKVLLAHAFPVVYLFRRRLGKRKTFSDGQEGSQGYPWIVTFLGFSYELPGIPRVSNTYFLFFGRM